MGANLKTAVFWIVVLISAFLLWQVVKGGQSQQAMHEISYSEFLSQVEGGSVAQVTISLNRVNGKYRDGSSFRVIVPTDQAAMLEALRRKGVEIWFKEGSQSNAPAQLLGTWAPLILLAVL